MYLQSMQTGKARESVFWGPGNYSISRHSEGFVGSDTARQYQRQTPCRFLLAARTDGLGQDRNGRAKVLLGVVVVVVVVVLVVLVVVLPLQILQAKS